MFKTNRCAAAAQALARKRPVPLAFFPDFQYRFLGAMGVRRNEW